MNPIPVLVLCDDYWHPGEIIMRGLQSIPQNKYVFDLVYDAKDTLTPSFLKRYPLIMCCKSNNVNGANQCEWFQPGVTEVMPCDLQDYVRQGHGYLAVHSGLSYGREDNSGMSDLNGCVFVRHPDRCDVELHVVQNDHPVVRGIETFVTRDEHYEIALTCDDADVFLKGTSATGGTQIAGYTRLMGEGRCCALTPGHILNVWEQPMFQQLVMNALSWCMKEDEA